jgi:ferritin-like metal-binding protein YciE
MPRKAGGLEQLFIAEVQDLFDAEKQVVRALPKMTKAVADEELSNLLREHLEQTKTQVQRLEQVFRSMDMPARSRPCKGMRGLVEEGQEMLSEGFDEGILDSAIVGSERKIEHYEMASYESARSLAQKLGRDEAVRLLDETLREEMETDRRFAQISKRLVKSAVSGAEMESAGGEEQTGRRSPRRSKARTSGARSSRTQGAGSRRMEARSSSRTTSGRSRGAAGHAAHPLTDHEEIRRWAEDRNAKPACVRGTGGGGDTGMIRLDFPGYSGRESLEEISWDDWFEKFDANNLALVVQETTTRGQKSNFNKIVSRESAENRERRPRARSAH